MCCASDRQWARLILSLGYFRRLKLEIARDLREHVQDDCAFVEQDASVMVHAFVEQDSSVMVHRKRTDCEKILEARD